MSRTMLRLLGLLVLVGAPPPAAAQVTFTDKAAQVGLGYFGETQGDMPTFSYQGSVAVVPSRHGGTWPVMKRTSSTKFTKVFSVLPSGEDGHGCTAADFTNPALSGTDGLVDLFCTKGACKGTCTRSYHKELWVQKPGGGFVNLAQQAGISQPHARGRDTTAVRLGGGQLVLAVANEASTLYPNDSIDRAYRVAGGRFTELPLYNAAGTARAKTASSCVVAVPRSGALPDLLYCENDGVKAYRHDGSKYRLTTAYGSFRARDMLVANVDGTGAPDVLVITQTALQLRRVGFSPLTLTTLGAGHGLAFGDMNCDGKGDILAVQAKGAQNSHVMLLNNGTGLSYRKVSFPRPSGGSGDTATYIRNWNGAGQPAMLVSNGYPDAGPMQFVVASCTR